MKIQKYHYWLLFFFVIFGFTFSMIIWTIKSAVNTPVYEDKSFFSTYHDVDDNFNKIMFSNSKIKEKYDVKITINDKTIGLETKDAFLGQRSLEKMSKNQEMLLLGENSIVIDINNKITNSTVSDANISFQITRAIDDMHDINLNDFKFENNAYISKANIDVLGNWNIFGKVIVGEDTGYLYIKTSTKK